MHVVNSVTLQQKQKTRSYEKTVYYLIYYNCSMAIC